ncbi:MAG: hypothetical protein CVV56_06790 [Tenericutes bacterium HGW-Tenericutes-1]|nr:MAG: hypothetical protein CVV56_06790 [Tenericutes bacterium HGW-Tenericutes-1]
MKKTDFESYFQDRNIPHDDFILTIKILDEIEAFLSVEIDDLTAESLDKAIELFYDSNRSNVDFFVAMMRYMRFIKQHDLFIRLTQYTGGLDVIESIVARMEKLKGHEKALKVLKRVTLPRLGMKPEDIIFFTETFMTTLHHEFGPEDIKLILTGNNHQIPISSFEADRIDYEASNTFEEFLKSKHQRILETLNQHFLENKVWFEQLITKEVIDYIASDQEMLSARLVDDTLYLKKIPYNIDGFLKENDPLQKRYLSCHCPFAREAILNKKADISPLWCYCSAGFEKHPFETVLNQPLKIRVLQSVLNGDDVCRFAISLDGVEYKK